MRQILLKLIMFLTVMSLAWSCATRGSEVIYKIKVMPGDTIISIATKYGTSWYAIARDNNIRDYRQVKVGDEVFVKPGPGGLIAQGDPGQSGFLGTVSEKEWRLRTTKKQNEQQDAAKEQRSKKAARGGFLFGPSDENRLNWPVSGGISSEYGPRWGRFHHGIDIRASSGTPIKSSHDGKVVFSGWRGGYGRLVVVQDDDGDFMTYYAHCRSLKVDVGDRVRRGQKIATVGASGHATGAHLHFEYRLVSGESRDPLDILDRNEALLSLRE